MAEPPVLPPVEGTDGGFSPNFDAPQGNGNGNGGSPDDGDAAASVDTPSQQPAERPHEARDPKTHEQVQRVLYSDIGVTTLLNRLKASIASARVGVRPPVRRRLC